MPGSGVGVAAWAAELSPESIIGSSSGALFWMEATNWLVSPPSAMTMSTAKTASTTAARLSLTRRSLISLRSAGLSGLTGVTGGGWEMPATVSGLRSRAATAPTA